MSTNKVAHNKKALLQALEKSLGVVTTACESVGVGRTSYYEYYKSDAKFKKAVDELADKALDIVESKLFERINGYEHPEDKIFNDNGTALIIPTIKHYPPDAASMIFYLKTKGKKRGYIERSEIDINDGVSKIIFEDASSSSKD